MHLVHSKSEERALQALVETGSDIAADPSNAALRRIYLAQREILREHARSGALIYRMSAPAPVRHIALDPQALAEFLAGSPA